MRKQKPTVKYRIRLKGLLPQPWTDWFEGLIISYEDNNTILTCFFEDQANLHGILNRIRDLNLILISVETLSEKNTEENL